MWNSLFNVAGRICHENPLLHNKGSREGVNSKDGDELKVHARWRKRDTPWVSKSMSELDILTEG